jgi:hypothetical protein
MSRFPSFSATRFAFVVKIQVLFDVETLNFGDAPRLRHADYKAASRWRQAQIRPSNRPNRSSKQIRHPVP